MTTFDTPNPISATIDVVGGDVRISAADGAATSVAIAPADATNDEDRKAAEQTRVDYTDGELIVKVPRLRSWLPRSTGGAVDVSIALPTGSRINGRGALTDFSCDGPLSGCEIKTGLGQIRIEEATTVKLKTGIGDITVERATGHADITAGSGEVRVRELRDGAVIKNSNGDTWIGLANGELRVSAANGDIAIDAAESGVVAKSSNGDVRLGAAIRKTVVLETKLGDIEVGVREGTAAWLDVRSTAGRVVNGLDDASAPDATAETVEVRARTSVGDVLIRRAQ